MTWRDRQEQFRRFAAWEAEQLRSRPADFGRRLAWMAAAWEIARRFDPEWGGTESAREHWGHLRHIRAALARARFTT